MQLLDLFDEVPLEQGNCISLELQQLLRSPLRIKDDWEIAENLLNKARQAFPKQLEILVALYKLYAYSNRFDEALLVIEEVLKRSAESGKFDPDWRRLFPDSTHWNNASGAVRCYLYSLKAFGFVSLRRGDIKIAYDALSKLKELDPLDQVGGMVVYELAVSLRDEDS